tara:strand:+ start:1839 stop:2435 length:597 start_codon:yes stop_codon:yes gene_type:complete
MSRKDQIELEELFKDFEHPNPYINQSAFNSMAKYWPQESVERLLPMLSNPDLNRRRKSVKALSTIGDIAIKSLIELFESSNDNIVKISCLKVFTIIASRSGLNCFPNEISIIINHSLIDDDPQIILAIISFLRRLNIEGLPYLFKASRSNNLLRAKAAITAIAEIDDNKSIYHLHQLSIDESINDFIRGEAIDYLGRK